MMNNNKKCIFTIVAKNYIGLAMVLEKSIKRYNPNIDFFIFIADEFDKDNMDSVPNNIFISKETLNISETKWLDMSFKYDLTAFCTAIKPSCFKFLFNSKNYQHVLYFDPDIFVFNSLETIFELLGQHSIILTPHIIGLHKIYNGEHPEKTILWHGIYNLGFCGISNTKEGISIVEWWEERLENKCFARITGSYFYDQKWMDMVPAFFDQTIVHISHNLGMNLAPWNYFEREIIKEKDEFFVKFRNSNSEQVDKLIFVHFAGYNYVDLRKGITKRLRLSVHDYKDIDLILDIYKNALNDDSKIFEKFINQKYTYSTFDNGILINRFHRNIYYGLTREGQKITNPFSTDKKSFYSQLKSKNMFDTNQQTDKYTIESYPNVKKNSAIIQKLFKVTYCLLGYQRYTLLIRALFIFAKPEKHTFLIKKRNITK